MAPELSSTRKRRNSFDSDDGDSKGLDIVDSRSPQSSLQQDAVSYIKS